MILFRIALLSLWQHRRRTGALGAAIAFVTALLVVMLGVSEGMNRSLVETATTLLSGHVNVGGFFKVSAGQSSPVVTKAKSVAEVVRREVPEAAYVVQRGRGWGKVVSEVGSQLLGLTGVDIEGEPGLRKVLKVKDGRLEDLGKPNAVALFEEQAAALEVRVGDAVTVSAPTPRGVNNTADLTVVAILKSMGMMSQFSCFVNEGTLRGLYQLNADTTGAVHVYLPTPDLEVVNRVKARLREALGAAGFAVMEDDPRVFFMKIDNVTREPWTGQRLDLTTWKDEVSFVSWTVDLLSVLSFFVAVLLLQVVGVGIMIVMWISIRERTREIGTLRAIGMQRASVLSMFLAEGFLLGLLSTLVGIVAGLLVSFALDAASLPLPQGVQFVLLADRLVVVPTVKWCLVTLAFITAVVTVISLLPAFLAARLKPVTAMAHAG